MRDDQTPSSSGRDRHAKRRFHIHQDVVYKVLYGPRLAESGRGATLNISSRGVLFTTESMLASGTPVEVSVRWPVLLNDSCPMKLMIFGCVIRSTDTTATVTIDRYEFRTQGANVFQQAAVVPAAESGLAG
jgi:hypothetical protein